MSEFSQKRSKPNEIFPFPEENEIVFENPPCLSWIADKENNGAGYTITLNGKNGFCREYHSDKCYFTPSEVLVSGEYEWNVTSNGKQKGKQRFTISDEAVIFMRPTARELYDNIDESVHPRALFFAEDIPDIVCSHAKDIKVLKRNITKAISDGIPLPPYDQSFEVNDSEYKYLHIRNYTNVIRNYMDTNLIALGLGWRLLGDSEAAMHGKKVILEIASWDHHHHYLTVVGPGGDEAALSVARTLAVAYDLLYDVLSEDERREVLKAVAISAHYCYERIIADKFEQHPGSSHTGRIPAYLGLMAVMLKGYEDEETILRYLETAMQIYGGLFPHYGSTDGGWGEGVFYATSYTKWFLPFFSCVERYTGKSYLDRPFYQNYSNFLLHFADADYENHPFGDGYWCSSEDEEWPGFFAQNPYRVYADKFGPAEAKEKEQALPTPEFFKLHLLDIFLPKTKTPARHLTRCARLADAFEKTGVFSMRSSFEKQDCMTVMARASRFGSASHSHSDQGSFALFFEGVSLISPSGYYGCGWGSKHHFEWTNTSRAHNTLVVNGEGQPTFSEKPVGKIEYCKQDGSLFSAELNLDDAYESLNSWKRLFTMNPSEKTLVIEDIVTSDGDVTLDFCLHTLGDVETKDGKVLIHRKGITLTVEAVEGLTDSIILSDKFTTELYEGADGYKKLAMPHQNHITLNTKKSSKHYIKVKFSVQKPGIFA